MVVVKHDIEACSKRSKHTHYQGAYALNNQHDSESVPFQKWVSQFACGFGVALGQLNPSVAHRFDTRCRTTETVCAEYDSLHQIFSEWSNGIEMLHRRIAPMRELERRFHLEGEQKLEWRCQGNMRKEVWRRKVLVYAILRFTPNPAGRSATCKDIYTALYLCDWQPQDIFAYKHDGRQRSVLCSILSACQTQFNNEIVSLSCMFAVSLCCFDCLLSRRTRCFACCLMTNGHAVAHNCMYAPASSWHQQHSSVPSLM